MPYTTVVAGTTITASWGNANVRDQVITPFATASARASAITSPIAGMVTYQQDVFQLQAYNGSVWVPVGVGDSTNVDTSQTTTSLTFTDLATGGPSVSVTTGGKALVIVGAQASNSAGGNVSLVGFAVSGASTIPAADAKSYSVSGTDPIGACATFLITGLTNGVNTFTAKYRVSAGTGTFAFRNITVFGIL